VFRSSIQQRNSLIIAVIFAIAAVFRFPCVDLRLSLRVLFEIFVTLTFAMYLWKINKWMAMFLVLAAFSIVIPYYGNVSLISHMAFVSVFFGMVVYYIIVETFTEKTVEYLYDAMCVIAIVNTLYMLMQFSGYDPLFKTKPGGEAHPVVGLMLNTNFTSALLALCFPAFLRKKWCWFIPLVGVGFVLAKSTGGILAVAVGLAVYFIAMGHRFATIIPVLIMFFFLLFVDKNFSPKDVRLEAWQYALELYKKHWIMGSGIGNWKIIGVLKNPHLQNQGWTALHNDFIQALFEMGIGFVILLCGYFYDIFKRFKEKALIPLVALIIISVNAMFNFPFHIGTTAMIAVVWLAILEIFLKEDLCQKKVK